MCAGKGYEQVAREIRPGDKLHITNDPVNFEIEVLAVSDILQSKALRTHPHPRKLAISSFE